jgi:hypothetical protein
MFQIKKYLHYKNTPDGKPRVLTEGVDYSYKYQDCLQLDESDEYQQHYTDIANLEDCRPLLTVEVAGEEWTEGNILFKYGDFYSLLLFEQHCGRKGLVSFGLCQYDSEEDYVTYIEDDNNGNFLLGEKLGSFFDDPAKYSKLLWNCTEEEGWEKVLKLLNI